MPLPRQARAALALCALPLCALPLFACKSAPVVVSLAPPSAEYTAEDYPQVLNRWTRMDKLLKELETTLNVHATWFSPDFSAAYVSRNADVFKLSRSRRQELEQRLAKEREGSYTFFVGAATFDFKWNDFDRRKSVWNITLINNSGEQVSPLEIKRAGPMTPVSTSFFPYLNKFSVGYHIHFPRTLPDGRPLIRPETERLTLRFAGPLGLAQLHWQFR